MVILMACARGADSAESGGGCGGPRDEPHADVVLTDANNGTYDATLAIGTIDVQSGADATVDWSALTTGLRSVPLDPRVVDRVYVIDFVGFTNDELRSKIEFGEVYANDAAQLYEWTNTTGATSVLLTEFVAFGEALVLATQFLEAPDHIWMLFLVSDRNDTTDVVQMAFLTPLTESSNTTVTLDNDTSTLDVAIDLESARPVTAQAGQHIYSVDWRDLNVDVHGHSFDVLRATQLQVARFDSAVTADVEDDLIRLDTAAAEFYWLDVFGFTGVDDLGEAEDAGGNAFPGFTTVGTWVIALSCPDCVLPGPVYLAVVQLQ